MYARLFRHPACRVNLLPPESQPRLLMRSRILYVQSPSNKIPHTPIGVARCYCIICCTAMSQLRCWLQGLALGCVRSLYDRP